MLLLTTLTLTGPARAQAPPPMVNGELTSEHPQVGALVVLSGQGGGSFCSGTLIHPEWVLTAGHCVIPAEDYDNAGARVLFYMAPNVYVQEDVVGYADADEFYVHPTYKGESSIGSAWDLGLLHLETPITAVPPMPLNTDDMTDWVGEIITFLGYGVTSDNGSGSGIKRKTNIPIRPETNDVVIYAYDPVQNLCSGDSGGGGLRQDDATGAWEIVGVNSFVFAVQSSNSLCVGGGSGSARIDTAMEWIEGYVPLDEVSFGAPALDVDDPMYIDTGDPSDPYDNDMVAEEPGLFGCSQVPGGSSLWVVAMAMGGLLLRRRD
ncbi:MAG: V8-like Glu-specific endopeptidase [Cognaticolwellia sp.]|jgi:V8-like Glu-specific endopeptidase